MTPPTPFIIPPISRERNQLSGISANICAPSQFTPESIQSIGYCPRENVVWNMINIRAMKIGYPQYLLVTTLSMRAVLLKVFLGLARVSVSFRAPSIKPYFASITAFSGVSCSSFFTFATSSSLTRNMSAWFGNLATNSSICLSLWRIRIARKRGVNSSIAFGFLYISAFILSKLFSSTGP